MAWLFNAWSFFNKNKIPHSLDLIRAMAGVSLEHHMLSGPVRAALVAPLEKLGPLTLQEDQSLRHLLLQPGILLLLSPHCGSDICIYIMLKS